MRISDWAAPVCPQNKSFFRCRLSARGLAGSALLPLGHASKAEFGFEVGGREVTHHGHFGLVGVNHFL